MHEVGLEGALHVEPIQSAGLSCSSKKQVLGGDGLCSCSRAGGTDHLPPRAKVVCANSSVQLDLGVPAVVDQVQRGGERQDAVCQDPVGFICGITDGICGQP